jgi:hypothetical protein
MLCVSIMSTSSKKQLQIWVYKKNMAFGVITLLIYIWNPIQGLDFSSLVIFIYLGFGFVFFFFLVLSFLPWPMTKPKCNGNIILCRLWRYEKTKNHEGMCFLFFVLCLGKHLGTMVSLTTLIVYLEVGLESFGLNILKWLWNLLPMHQHTLWQNMVFYVVFYDWILVKSWPWTRWLNNQKDLII